MYYARQAVRKLFIDYTYGDRGDTVISKLQSITMSNAVTVYIFSLPRGEKLVWRIFLLSFYFAHFLSTNIKYYVEGILYIARGLPLFICRLFFRLHTPPPPAI